MDEKSEQLLREIKKYQKSTAAYEKARLKMIKREHRALGLTDAVMQRELKSINVDVKSLLKDTAAEEKELQRTHKRFLALVRPPILPGDLVLEIPPDPNVFDVKPPAIQGFGGGSFSDADCGFNLA